MYILVLLSFVIFHIISHCCPYGLMLVVLLVLALAASMTTWFAAFDCSFYEVNTLGIGLWTTQDPFLFGQVTVCYGWDNTRHEGTSGHAHESRQELEFYGMRLFGNDLSEHPPTLVCEHVEEVYQDAGNLDDPQ
jgi:hypothetical protein